MTPKEKAQGLVDRMNNVVGGGNYDAKEYALIAVDEIIKEVTPKVVLYTYQLQFWQEVKTEIEKL